jgi:hypothetical protein
MGLVLDPISAYGVPAPLADQGEGFLLGMHSTYDPEYRTQFYTRPGDERYVSSGCVNCRPEDFTTMMNTLGGPDTVMVVDTKNPNDKRLFEAAMQRKVQKQNDRQAYTVVPSGGGMPTTMGTSRYEYGGQTLDQVYQMMKRGGLNYDPKKKKGKQESFEEYQMRMGGLSKYQGPDQSQVGPEAYDPSPMYADWGNTENELPPPAADPLPIMKFPPFPRDNMNDNIDYSEDPLNTERTNREINRFRKPELRRTRREIELLQKQSDAPYTPSVYYQQQQQSKQNQSGQDQRSAFGPGGRGQGQNPYSNNLYNTYQTGQNFTNMFGNKAGAWSSIIGGGLSAMAGFGSGFGKSKFRYKQYDSKGNVIDKGRLKGESANIAASNLFNRYGQPQQQQQVAQQQVAPQNTKMGYGFNVPHMGKLPDMVPYRFEEGVDQIAKPPTKYFQAGGNPSMDFRYTTYTGPNEQSMMSSAWSSGVADAFELNRREDELEKLRTRSTGMSMVPATTAQKTQAGSPQGAINAPSFVPKTTVGNFGQDTYMQNPMMNYGQYGGMMMDDLYEDGGEYELDDMTPEDRDELLRRLIAAGYDIEYLD